MILGEETLQRTSRQGAVLLVYSDAPTLRGASELAVWAMTTQAMSPPSEGSSPRSSADSVGAFIPQLYSFCQSARCRVSSTQRLPDRSCFPRWRLDDPGGCQDLQPRRNALYSLARQWEKGFSYLSIKKTGYELFL